MRILGIETSCDETAAAVVENGTKVLSSVVGSSLRFHQKYGGIIPEIAFRKQLETIGQIVDCAIRESGVQLHRVDAVGVTHEPGLAGSLLVGISFAEALAMCIGKPLIRVNHLHGHLYSPALNAKKPMPLPAIGLVVSGGHTGLYVIRSFKNIQLLGSTQDDACGEAFDKVAKILGLGYPGGPVIETLAAGGDPRALRLSCSNTKTPFDFSYSGIKTAVLYHAQKHRLGIFAKRNKKTDRARVADVCASFQDAALRVLIDKTIAACKTMRIRSAAVGGGVAANRALRKMFDEAAGRAGITVAFPARDESMDNAAMIAGIAHHLIKGKP